MKICFIGNTGHTLQAFNEMKRCEEAEFVGIAPGSEHEDPEGLKKYGMKVFASYQDMIAEVQPDVAVISPVFGLTGNIIKYCAERKIDVFSEKPVAGTLEELEEVKKAVQQNNIHFSAMHFLRFTPSFYHAQKMVEQGAIGKIQLITAQKSYKYGKRPDWYKNRNLYTGTIPWIGIHAIDWIYYFSKKKFISVNAFHIGNPETAALCQFKLEGGIIASANIDFLRPQSAPSHGDDRVRVAGSEGVIEVFENKFILINKDGVTEYAPKAAPKLAYDYLLKKEEICADEIFMLTEIALLARKSADKNNLVEMGG